MRKTKTFLAAIFAASTLAIGACSLFPNADAGEKKKTWGATSTERYGCEKLYTDFFAPSVEDTNQVVTLKKGTTTTQTETISGTSDYISRAGNIETWSFIKDGTYYWAANEDGNKHYLTGQSVYEEYYRTWYSYLSQFKHIPSTQTSLCTYALSLVGEGILDKDDNMKTSTSSLTLQISAEGGSLKITAEAKDEKLTKVTYDQTSGTQTETMVYEFTYGSATVTLPDLSTWNTN